MRLRYLLFLILLLPAYYFRDYTPNNELRYVSIVDEALKNHTYFTFYTHGELYADKPPLYFWLMMLLRKITGDYYLAWMGLLSLLPMLGVMGVMNRWMRFEEIPHKVGRLGDMLLVSTGIFLGGALVLRMDMLMTYFIVLSLYIFYRIYQKRNKPWEWVLLPLYLFLALFTKGPMGVLIPLVSIVSFLILKKDLSAYSRCFGWRSLGVFFILCASWFTLVYVEGGKEYLYDITVRQTLGRGINAFDHKEAFYFYFQRIGITFAPWVLLYLVAAYYAFKQKLVKSDLQLFFVCIVVSSFIMLSLISAKLDIYLLPIYPFVSFLTALWLAKMKSTIALKVAVALPATLFILLLPALYFTPKLIPFPYERLYFVYMAGVCLAAGGALAWSYLYQNNLRSAIISIASGILGMVFVVSFAIPQFNSYIGFEDLANKGQVLAQENQTNRYACYKVRSGQNMDIYIHTPIKQIQSVDELELLSEGPLTILFIDNYYVEREPQLAKFLQDYQKNPVGLYSIYKIGR